MTLAEAHTELLFSYGTLQLEAVQARMRHVDMSEFVAVVLEYGDGKGRACCNAGGGDGAAYGAGRG